MVSWSQYLSLIGPDDEYCGQPSFDWIIKIPKLISTWLISDKYLTMAKYSSSNGEAKEVNSMMEEERRSKAYSKIIGAQTAQSLVSGNQESKNIQQSFNLLMNFNFIHGLKLNFRFRKLLELL